MMINFDDSVAQVIAEARSVSEPRRGHMYEWMLGWNPEHYQELGLFQPLMSVESVRKSFDRADGGQGKRSKTPWVSFPTFFNDSILRMVLAYFDEAGFGDGASRPDLAQAIRTSVYVNALRRGIVYQPYPEGTAQHGKLDWLLSPADPAGGEAILSHIRDWRRLTQHGDASLYDHGKALFMFLQNSPLHLPYLRRFALSLASVAITYNDYGDALTVARWHADQIEALSKGDTREIPTRRDVHQGNRIFASATTYLHYTEQFDDFRDRFAEVVEKIERDAALGEVDRVCLLKDARRCLVRHAVNYRLRSVVLRELRDIPAEDRNVLVGRYVDSLNAAQDLGAFPTGLEYDTRCRAHAALQGDFVAAENARWDSLTRFRSEEAGFSNVVSKANLNTVWKQVTECVLSASQGLYAEDPGTRSFKGESVDELLNTLILQVKPENMRHSRNYEALLRSVSYSCKYSEYQWKN